MPVQERRHSVRFFPEEEKAKLKFASYDYMTDARFVIYTDMETMIGDEVLVKNGKMISKQQHMPTSVSAVTVCKPRPEFGNSPFLYTVPDCIEMLMMYLNEEVRRAQSI